MNVQSYIKENYRRDSQKAADKVGIPRQGEWNGKRDAFRHVYTSAVITKHYGVWTAQELGNRVETSSDNSSAEHWMDYRNNSIGRDIGVWAARNNKTDFEIAQEVKRRMDNGDVILSPYDPIRTYEAHGEWERAKRESRDAIKRDRETTLGELRREGESTWQTEQRFDQWEKWREEEIEKHERRMDKDSGNQPEENKESPTNSGGDVQVESYDRKSGHVKSHTRSRPDGDPSNNFSSSSNDRAVKGAGKPSGTGKKPEEEQAPTPEEQAKQQPQKQGFVDPYENRPGSRPAPQIDWPADGKKGRKKAPPVDMKKY